MKVSKFFIGVLLYISVFSYSVNAAVELTEEEKSAVMTDLATYTLVSDAINVVIDEHFKSYADGTIFPNSDAMNTLMLYSTYINSPFSSIPNASSVNVKNINTIFDKIENEKADSLSLYSYSKLAIDVADLFGLPVSLLSVGVNSFDFSTNMASSIEYGTNSVTVNEEALLNAGLNTYGAYMGTVKLALWSVKHMAADKAAALIAEKAFWTKNAISKGLSKSATLSGVGAGTLAAQLVAEIYKYVRDNKIDDINENVFSSHKTSIEMRNVNISRLIELYKNKEVLASSIERNDIIDALTSTSVQVRYSKIFEKKNYILDDVFNEYSLDTTYLSTNYSKSTFAELSNEEKIYVALDALVKIAMIEDSELEMYILEIIGTKLADKIFALIPGISSFDTTSFLQKMFIYYDSRDANGVTYSSFDYYNLIFKVTFNSEVAKVLQFKLAELGREVEKLKKAQVVKEERDEGLSRLIDIAPSELGDTISVWFNDSVDFKDDILATSTSVNSYRFSYLEDGASSRSVVYGTYDATTGAVVFTSPTTKAYTLYYFSIVQEPRYSSDTEVRLYTYPLPVANTGVYVENLGATQREEAVAVANNEAIVFTQNPIKKTEQTTSYTDFDDGYYQSGISHNYTRDDTLEIVTDNVTGLIWQDNLDAKDLTKTWQEAIDYCSVLSFAGQSDWRLPSIEELQSIVVDGKYNPSIDITFQNITSYYYWSATTLASYTSYAWYVYFYRGYTGYYGKANSFYVRCVRGGQ